MVEFEITLGSGTSSASCEGSFGAKRATNTAAVSASGGSPDASHRNYRISVLQHQTLPLKIRLTHGSIQV